MFKHLFDLFAASDTRTKIDCPFNGLPFLAACPFAKFVQIQTKTNIFIVSLI